MTNKAEEARRMKQEELARAERMHPRDIRQSRLWNALGWEMGHKIPDDPNR